MLKNQVSSLLKIVENLHSFRQVPIIYDHDCRLQIHLVKKEASVINVSIYVKTRSVILSVKVVEKTTEKEIIFC